MKVLLLLVMLALPGCAVLPGTQPVTTRPAVTIEDKALAAIADARASLIAAANVIGTNVADGIWTKEQGNSYLDRVEKYAGDLKDAQALVKKGNAIGAQQKTDAVRALILALHREVAAQARKGTQ